MNDVERGRLEEGEPLVVDPDRVYNCDVLALRTCRQWKRLPTIYPSNVCSMADLAPEGSISIKPLRNVLQDRRHYRRPHDRTGFEILGAMALFLVE